MKDNMMNKISVIIPLYNDYKSIKFLLIMLANQSLQPDEVIVVDSSENKRSFSSLTDNFDFKLIHKKIDKAYPGKARNVGIKSSTNNIISFLDCKTFPKRNWLEQMMNKLISNNYSIVYGSRISISENKFKSLLKLVTYGNESTISISGSILIKEDLIKNNLFYKEEVRAGEDLLWIEEYNKSDLKIGKLNESNHIYYGFPENVFKLAKKWFIYSISNSQIPILKLQKYVYSAVFFMFLIFIILGAQNSDNDLIKIPFLIAKYIIILLVITHFFFRVIIKPISIGISLKQILPLFWIKIYLLSLFLDIIKLPGSILGFFNLIFKTKTKND